MISVLISSPQEGTATAMSVARTNHAGSIRQFHGCQYGLQQEEESNNKNTVHDVAASRRQLIARQSSSNNSSTALLFSGSSRQSFPSSFYFSMTYPIRHYSSTRLVASSTDDSEKSNKTENKDDGDEDEKEPTKEESSILIYTSPHSGTILRLRFVTWFTGFGGAFGFPLSYASKDGDPTTIGFWALSLCFGLATMSTTAAVTYVFLPYVYSIEMVPNQKFNYNKSANAMDSTITTTPQDLAEKPHLYMATTRSLFLFPRQHYFDPATELIPYSGIFEPLTNLQIQRADNDTEDGENDDQKKKKKTISLYVHPEEVYDNTILKVLGRENKKTNSSSSPAIPLPTSAKKNPDEELLKSKSS
eukprot:CAMPEP_0198148584 /NCGR_PEP_ID=MMETSP1443-20131203/42159_1 /TAXON_ID=186043 /ORGANISM="Entomoneis sp., Strain CCMP2396" /LENGTH=359 /DNA_ID=CAMNT_0043813303 /DNA_START=165 /DNA_END=1244 /DNA_ORIENTATION=-